MSLGKPIVSFDLKETRFSAQEAALYATPNDITEYAENIITLMDSPDLREKMGKYGMERIEKHLAWQVVSEKLLDAYKKLIPKKD